LNRGHWNRIMTSTIMWNCKKKSVETLSFIIFFWVIYINFLSSFSVESKLFIMFCSLCVGFKFLVFCVVLSWSVLSLSLYLWVRLLNHSFSSLLYFNYTYTSVIQTSRNLLRSCQVVRTDRHEDLVRPKNILPVRKKGPKIHGHVHNV
jgi:hypothetical protein